MNRGANAGSGATPAGSPSGIWGVTAISGTGYSTADPWSLKLSAATRPSSSLSLAEQHLDTNIMGNASGSCVSNPSNQLANYPAGHLGSFNYLFIDGHGQSLRPADTVAPGGSLTMPKGIWTITAQGL
jgi:prepilin-type processing-associated H-X9-DG protein